MRRDRGCDVVQAMDAATRLEFMPAAIEIRERAASPTACWLLRVIIALVACTVAWAVAGSVDVVAVAPGKIIPRERSKILQPFDPGVVREIHVHEGAQVRAGEPLISFDGTEVFAELERIGGELDAESLELAGAVALLALLDAEAGPPPDIDAAIDLGARRAAAVLDVGQRSYRRELLRAHLEEYRARQAALRNREHARRAERRAVRALASKLERSLPILAEQTDSLEQLYARNLASRHQWLDSSLARIGAEQELAAARERLTELAEEIEGIVAERDTQAAAERRAALLAVETHRREVSALMQTLVRLEEREKRLELRAPIDGTVQQLAVHAPGAVVTPAQPLMRIVPLYGRLEVEAFVLNRDIGFVEEEQHAEVKVDTFNFTRYGLVPGWVRSVSAEAVEHERFGLSYPARIALEAQSIGLDGGRAMLAPGMSVQVEIRTGRRRIIDYFMSPLAAVVQESIRER